MPADKTIHLPEPKYYAHFSGMKLTAGVRDLADKARAHWLIDRIATTSREKLSHVELIVWTLKVQNRQGVLSATDGDENSLFVERIRDTDFPQASVTIWAMQGVLLLPAEY